MLASNKFNCPVVSSATTKPMWSYGVKAEALAMVQIKPGINDIAKQFRENNTRSPDSMVILWSCSLDMMRGCRKQENDRQTEGGWGRNSLLLDDEVEDKLQTPCFVEYFDRSCVKITGLQFNRPHPSPSPIFQNFVSFLDYLLQSCRDFLVSFLLWHWCIVHLLSVQQCLPIVEDYVYPNFPWPLKKHFNWFWSVTESPVGTRWTHVVIYTYCKKL